MNERLQIVDENDQPVGHATREEAWAKGFILRHAYMVIRDQSGNFLLQQRSLKKKAGPGIWTWSATGHVDEGESYETAAHRELLEEVGLKADLEFVGKYRSTQPNDFGVLDVFVSIFTGTIDRSTPIMIDPEEVATTDWVSEKELDERVSSHPEQFTRNMIDSYQRFFAQN